MASRAIWKGQLRLSLVAIPIEIHAATKSGRRVSFRQIHGPSGKPVSYEKTVPGIGKVSQDDILKGYALGDNEYLLIEPDEIDAIKLETKKTFELVQFVGTNEISPLYYDQPYYIVPSDELAEDAYRVVRDALRKANRTGLGQLTLHGREHLCAVRPCGDGLLMETLFYADEIRDAEPLFNTIEDDEADPDLLSVATALIEKKTAPFDASAYVDHYDQSLRQLIEDKRKGRAPRVTAAGERPAADNVVDLMQALKDSLKASGAASAGASKSGASRAGAKPAPRGRTKADTTAKAEKAAKADEPAEKPRARRTPRKAG